MHYEFGFWENQICYNKFAVFLGKPYLLQWIWCFGRKTVFFIMNLVFFGKNHISHNEFAGFFWERHVVGAQLPANTKGPQKATGSIFNESTVMAECMQTDFKYRMRETFLSFTRNSCKQQSLVSYFYITVHSVFSHRLRVCHFM